MSERVGSVPSMVSRRTVVQVDFGHRRPDDVVHVRLDLLLRVGQTVVRGFDRIVVGDDLVLDGDADGQEHLRGQSCGGEAAVSVRRGGSAFTRHLLFCDAYVIPGLRFAGDFHLLEAHRNGGRDVVDERDQAVQAGACDCFECTTSLNDFHTARSNGV